MNHPWFEHPHFFGEFLGWFQPLRNLPKGTVPVPGGNGYDLGLRQDAQVEDGVLGSWWHVMTPWVCWAERHITELWF